MKSLGKMLSMAGIVVIVYSVVGRFVGGPTIGMGIIEATPKAGMILGNSLILISIALNQLENK